MKRNKIGIGLLFIAAGAGGASCGTAIPFGAAEAPMADPTPATGGGATTYSIGGSISNLIGTVVLQNNGADNLTLTASGNFTFPVQLSAGSAYAVTVLTQPSGQTCTVSSGSGTASATVTTVSISCVSYKRIYVTSTSSVGNLGGVSGADTACVNDTNKPAGVTSVKAMLVAATRVACTTANCTGGVAEHTDWVLLPSTEYRRSDGTTVIGTTTNAGIFTFPLTSKIGTGAGVAWTGLSTNWTNNVNNCTNWTSGVAGAGNVGDNFITASNAVSNGGTACTFSNMLYCVEQ